MPRHRPLILPPALARGDRIRIVAPASPFDRARLEKGAADLRSMGFAVDWREDVFAASGYLAGDDDRRAAELTEAFADPGVKGIVCARGGYGTPRLLERLDFEAMARLPKVLVGFSDVTALHLAFQARTGMVTIHGPNATGRMAEPGLEEGERDWLSRLITRASPIGPLAAPGEVLVPGEAEGPLLGGNLALVTALLGTPYSPDYEGAILFLEDVGEKPFRVDRMLTHLKLAGVLDGVAGIALGRFSGCANAADPDDRVENLIARTFRDAGKPCIAGLPVGHDGENFALPMGIRARIEARNSEPGRLAILEAAVGPPVPSA